MSRSIKKANEYIFGLLAEFVQSKNVNISISTDDERRIQLNTQDEKKWLEKLKIKDEEIILPTFRTAWFEFKHENQPNESQVIKYFVTIGATTQLSTQPEIIQVEELNGGMITALIFELKIPVKQSANPFEIINEIFYIPEAKTTKYELYEYSVVSEFFETIFVYKIQDDCSFIESNINNETTVNILRLSGFYITKTPQIRSLPFEEDTIFVFERLFLEGAKNIPFDNLVFSLVSVYWRYSFLDVYRCIERLFSISFLEDFHEKLGIKDSLLNFSSQIEENIGWKPKENEAINKLIANSPKDSLKDAIELLQEVKNSIEGKNTQINKLPIKFLFWVLVDINRLIDILFLWEHHNTEGKLGEVIYKIRNSIVHFRPATEYISIDDKHWDKLIRASLLIIEYWYHKYDEQM
ncbi:MAG TPA: hypothetical protein VK184_14040 [Nostocaceae cyanobacterium]|nr:hypothetical protein [Nostocaceae cyanobacterium]